MTARSSHNFLVRAPETPQHDPVIQVDRHVLGRIGLRFEIGTDDPDDSGSAPRTVALDPAPPLLEFDGHVGFGALGVLFDMASSTALEPDEFRPFLHADITVHRLRPPQGSMRARAEMVRRGKRTGVVDIDLVDDTGQLVATSTQELVFARDVPPSSPAMTKMRESFRSMFDGVCRLDQPLARELDIVELAGGKWRMALGPDRTNGFGGLHGGVATTLVDAAASGRMAQEWGAPARTVSASVRYLSPALVGPFEVEPEVCGDDGTIALLRLRVRDTGADDRIVILADVHVRRD